MRTTRRPCSIVTGILLLVVSGGCSSETASLSTNHRSSSKATADSSQERLDEILAVGMTVDEVMHALQMEKFARGVWGGAGWMNCRGRSNRCHGKTVSVSFEESGVAGAYFLKRWHFEDPSPAVDESESP
jgi:hypothetical protein